MTRPAEIAPHVLIGTSGAGILGLPVDVVTQTVAILAKRRAGKSYLARVFAEELHRLGQQVVIIDPKGDWFGIRSAANGKGPGLQFVILGGEHGDLPLEVGSGELVARLVVEDRVSLVVDLSLFRKSEVASFMGIFLETVYRLKARDEFRTPVMLVIDEADAIAPQKPFKGQERMLGAAEDIVRRGGQRGLGCLLVSQRAAVLNKNVLTQAQLLCVLRTISPQDTEALDDWIKVHGTKEERATLMASLASLPTGVAWLWSPGWPDDAGIFERVAVARIRTYDSGRTPKPGEALPVAWVSAVDLDVLRTRMAATIERAQASSPVALQKRIAALEAELRKASRSSAPSEMALADARKEAREEVYDAMRELAASVAARDEHLRRLVPVLRDASDGLGRIFGELTSVLGRPLAVEPVPVSQPQMRSQNKQPAAAPRPRAISWASEDEPAPVSDRQPTLTGDRAALLAVAQTGDVGASREFIGLLTGFKKSYRNLCLQRLAAAGLIEKRDGLEFATAAGLAELGDAFTPLPTGAALRSWWLSRLPEGERKALETVLAAWPEPVRRDEIDAAQGFRKSYRNQCVQRLAVRGLVVTLSGSLVQASRLLFD